MNPAEFRADSPYASFGDLAIAAPADQRLAFIRKTYMHLAAAIYAFVAIEFAFFHFGFADWMLQFIQATPMVGLVMLGAFLVTSWIATYWARSDASIGLQYAGLFLYVLLEAVIFVPLLYIAQGQAIRLDAIGNVSVITVAAIATLAMFGGLSAVVYFTKRDFSFMGTGLWMAGIGAMVLIIVSAIAGFHLGVWFSAGMIIFACGWILYDTSNVLHHYRTDQHVAASLALFASIAILFFYILRFALEMSRGNR